MVPDGGRGALVRRPSCPVTVAGLSRYNIANALAAAAACDALGLRTARIARGLRSFAQDSAGNPGRLNLFERGGTFVVIDFAHNEAGLAGLMDVSRAIAGRGKVRLAIGTAGDRTDEILTALGVLAGAADDVVIAEKEHYLRGRSLEGMNELLRAGVRQGGYTGEHRRAPQRGGGADRPPRTREAWRRLRGHDPRRAGRALRVAGV